jgi:hypothetical protein
VEDLSSPLLAGEPAIKLFNNQTWHLAAFIKYPKSIKFGDVNITEGEFTM